MIPNIHQSIEDIIKNASNSEKILWQQIRLITGENAGVRQLQYTGGLGGVAADFTTYSANKLFLCLEISISSSNFGLAAGGVNYITFADLSNVTFFAYHNNSLVWNTTGAAVNYSPLVGCLHNFYFSRIDNINGFSYISFIGYRITF